MFRKRRLAAITQAAAQHREFFKANMERKHAERYEKRAARINAKQP